MPDITSPTPNIIPLNNENIFFIHKYIPNCCRIKTVNIPAKIKVIVAIIDLMDILLISTYSVT